MFLSIAEYFCILFTGKDSIIIQALLQATW